MKTKRPKKERAEILMRFDSGGTIKYVLNGSVTAYHVKPDGARRRYRFKPEDALCHLVMSLMFQAALKRAGKTKAQNRKEIAKAVQTLLEQGLY